MKIKQILISLMALSLVVGTVNATLWDYFDGDLPSVSERVELAENCDINEYEGSYDQNVALEDCLRLNTQNEPNLGGTTPIAGGTFTLAGAGVSSTATSIILSSFTITQTDYEILTADLSDTFYITIEPGNKTRQEIVSCTTVTQSGSSANATLSGCTRGLKPFGTYAADSNYRFSHAGGSQVILSDPPQLFNQYTAKANNETVAGFWDFTYLPTSSATPTSTSHLVNKTYVDNQVNQGAATSTPATAGISELATANETASSTPWGITEPHVIQSQYATSTPVYSCDDSGTSGAKCVVVGESDGKLNQSWLDLTETFTFQAPTNFYYQVDMLGTVYTNYLGGSFNIGYSNSLTNATGTLNVLGDTFITGNATTTGDLDVEGDINGSSVNNNYYSTASDNLKISEDSEDTTTSATYALLKTIRINTTGGARVKYDIKTDSNAINGQLWKNGSDTGSCAYGGSDTSYQTESCDLTFLHTGDVLQVYAKHAGAGATISATNFRVYFNVNNLGQYGIGLD